MRRASAVADWRDEFLDWLASFLAAFGREAQRHGAPLYLEGLLGPGERKSVEPMAMRVCPGETQQLHHFVSTSPWGMAALEQGLAVIADRLVDGPEAVLIIDDTALPKEGTHSVGGARQVSPADVALTPPTKGSTGRPQTHPVPAATSGSAEAVVEALGPRAFRRLSWRTGTNGPLVAEFAASRAAPGWGCTTTRSRR